MSRPLQGRHRAGGPRPRTRHRLLLATVVLVIAATGSANASTLGVRAQDVASGVAATTACDRDPDVALTSAWRPDLALTTVTAVTVTTTDACAASALGVDLRDAADGVLVHLDGTVGPVGATSVTLAVAPVVDATRVARVDVAIGVGT